MSDFLYRFVSAGLQSFIWGGVPVYTDAERFNLTFDLSLDLLLQDRMLLIFPEDPDLPLDPLVNMRPFKKGFIRLAELYFQTTSRSLNFHPLAVHAERSMIRAGRPIRHNPFARAVHERLRIKHVHESMIREMYLDLGGRGYAGIPLPR